MTMRGLAAVVGVDRTKLAAQWKVRLAIAACAAGPFAFAAAMRVQSAVPTDTLFGRAIADSGFALPLVVLGFGSLWALPVLASIVGGDVFAAEDRYGTWSALLVRSRTRAEIFAGKLIAAVAFSCAAVVVLGASSIAAGVLVIGSQPLVTLSGTLVPPAAAAVRVALSWASIVPPVLAFTGLAILASVAARSSVAGIGLPVLAAFAVQLYALVDASEWLRRLLPGSAFSAWHGLLVQPPYARPVLHGVIVSAAYFFVSIAAAFSIVKRRDVGR